MERRRNADQLSLLQRRMREVERSMRERALEESERRVRLMACDAQIGATELGGFFDYVAALAAAA